MSLYWCNFAWRGGGWICGRCGKPSISKRPRPPLRQCRLGVAETRAAEPCPLSAILHAAPPTADPAAYVARLTRCRAANCGLLHLVDGVMKCVGRGRSCEWLGEWARFLAGTDDCPHWGDP